MSDPSDRGSSKPPRGPGAGASGSPGSIGKALGGDLDFEPDLLLDALTEEEARPTQRPPDPPPGTEARPGAESTDKHTQATIVDEHELGGSERPSFVDDEVTVVGQRDFFESSLVKPGPPPVPPRRAASTESSAPTPLVQPPKMPPVTTPNVSRPAGVGGLRPPPTVPRPLVGTPITTKADVSAAPRPAPRPGSTMTGLGGPPPSPKSSPTAALPPPVPKSSPMAAGPPPLPKSSPNAASPAPIPKSSPLAAGPPPLPKSSPLAAASPPMPPSVAPTPEEPPATASPSTTPTLSPEPVPSSAPGRGPESSTPPEGEARTSLTPEEIAALDELEELESLAPARDSGLPTKAVWQARSEEHTSELQSQ